ncbi:hypothetical protein [Taibaiella helva]|uniref:hypothetical protein n=1 Tax=Taibaiella helva TaxID=2301235 RepID=UPI00130093A0|nr:hypothetical protein [Taibaiella helva]
MSMLLLATAVFESRASNYNAILHKPYKDKVWWIDSFYRAVVAIRDSSQAFAVSSRLREEAIAAKDRELALEADLFDAYYRWYHYREDKTHLLDRFMQLRETGRKEHYLHIEARSLYVIAKTYWRIIQNYELAFEYYLQLDQLMQQTNAYSFPDITEYYHEIGKAYYIFKDYRTALAYLHKASAIKETRFSYNAHWASDNTMGLCYQKLNRLDSSDHYFNKVIHSPYIEPSDAYYSIAKGNLGYNRYLSGDFAAAIPMLQEDIAFGLSRKDSGLVAGSAIPLGDIMIRQGRLDAAQDLIRLAQSSIISSRQYDRMERLYPVLCKYYAARGDIVRVNRYLDSTVRFSETMEKKFSALQLLRAQQKMDRLELQGHRRALQLERRLNQVQRGFFLSTLLLLIVGVLFAYYRIRRKHKYRQAVQEQKVKAFRAELKRGEEQIREFAERLSEKNQLIEKLEEEDTRKQHTDILSRLRESAILTDEDWTRFRQSFDIVYGDYINNVKQKFPHITPAELRLLVLGRLNFSTKEMATALGISPNSVRVTWHRLRRKLELGEETSLEALSHSL